jgi:hypothetical protein
MARQTQKDMLMSRRVIGYEELEEDKKIKKADDDVDMQDVEEVQEQELDAEAIAAEVLSRLSLGVRQEGAAVGARPRTRRRFARARGARFASNNKFKVSSDSVHQRVRHYDIDNMADDRRGGGGGGGGGNYNNRKRRFNRGIHHPTLSSNSASIRQS